MDKLQLSESTMDPRNQRQPLPPPPSVNLFVMQHLVLPANTIHWWEGLYSLPFCAGPVYQGIAQQQLHQYRVPSSGPSRIQRSKGSRKAEAQHRYNFSHESSGMIAGDRSTGIHPGHARIGANDNAGACKVWRTPSRNPLMDDHNSTQQMRMKPYNRNHSSRTRRRRTDKVDLSVYEIPIVESKRGMMAGGPKIPTTTPAMLATWTTAPGPSTAYMEPTRYTNKEKQNLPVEEDDFDTISLGSDTD